MRGKRPRSGCHTAERKAEGAGFEPTTVLPATRFQRARRAHVGPSLAVGEGIEPPTVLPVTVFKTAWRTQCRTYHARKEWESNPHGCPRPLLPFESSAAAYRLALPCPAVGFPGLVENDHAAGARRDRESNPGRVAPDIALATRSITALAPLRPRLYRVAKRPAGIIDDVVVSNRLVQFFCAATHAINVPFSPMSGDNV